MIKVSIVGTGNVAHHLIHAFAKSNAVRVIEIIGRDTISLDEYRQLGSIRVLGQKPLETDIIILAVSDSVIGLVSEQFTNADAIVAHTSGAIPMMDIKHDRAAVFYPLQTFSKSRAVNFSGLPICVEASNAEDQSMLEQLGNGISNNAIQVDSKQRLALHAAAVFANNFSNHLFYLAQGICDQNHVDFSVLEPLITETVAKALELNPLKSQTGPARRGDYITQQKHLELLKDVQLETIYRTISQSIYKTYERQL